MVYSRVNTGYTQEWVGDRSRRHRHQTFRELYQQHFVLTVPLLGSQLVYDVRLLVALRSTRALSVLTTSTSSQHDRGHHCIERPAISRNQ